MTEAEVCGSCRFWSEETHLCRRNAPVLVADGYGEGDPELGTRWPTTDIKDWCGEYEPVLVEEEYEDEEEYDEGGEWAEDGSPAW